MKNVNMTGIYMAPQGRSLAKSRGPGRALLATFAGVLLLGFFAPVKALGTESKEPDEKILWITGFEKRFPAFT